MHWQQLLKQLSNHIVFRGLHHAFIAVQLRDELWKTSAGRRSQKMRPFTLWLTHILLSYAGDILVSLLLGILPLEPLNNAQDVALCTAAWYIVFYSPFDVAYAVARTAACRCLVAQVTALNQVLHIERGVQLATKTYGRTATLPILIIGTVIGSGAEFLKPVAALLINRCQLQNVAYVKLSTNSKLALLVTWLYLVQLNHSRLLLGLRRCQLQLYVLLALTIFRILAVFCRMDHLIWQLENRLCYALFGGLNADLNKFFKRKIALAPRKSFSKLD
ncbi:trimeric intracellular cation channel type 1B.1 [Drosophila mojavensis]|uniref:trimeric intracellular cation channel type 1B.1 n=1 Tax=Drosophila mojavensis TaxID=7230 RepID=UPI001CD0EE46|nr:trimeric intracellular cation channel type 1B.1 [Drosophila mojavensis]